MVKVILWKGEVAVDESRKFANKITAKEWRKYCKQTLKINILTGRKIVSANLKELWKVINKNEGFEEIKLKE